MPAMLPQRSGTQDLSPNHESYPKELNQAVTGLSLGLIPTRA